jgi:integrase
LFLTSYYITYYVGSKKCEKAVGPRLSMALQEKMERENKGRRGNYEVIERQEKTSFKQWHIYKPFKEILNLGIDTMQYSWKELRHTTASLMHRKGVPALVIKDQLRHTNVKTTVDFYIGSDVSYQREMIEKLILNSGKIVGNGEISQPTQLPTA